MDPILTSEDIAFRLKAVEHYIIDLFENDDKRFSKYSGNCSAIFLCSYLFA